ncbi:MAG: hypothetical protein AAGI23_07325 [Bacteroidota bacterium]
MGIEITKDDKVAIVANYSHIAARALVDQLIEHPSYRKIILIDEQQPTFEHDKVVNYALDTEQLSSKLKGDDLFCFYSIHQTQKHVTDVKIRDLFAFQLAKLAAINNVGQLMLLTSSNTDKGSMNFNSRIRAHLEESVNALPFWAVHLFRPTVIVNTENKSRWGEGIANRIGKGLDFLTGGMVSRYRPVEARLLAKTMLDAAQQLEEGRFRYHPSYFVEAEEEEKGLQKR